MRIVQKIEEDKSSERDPNLVYEVRQNRSNNQKFINIHKNDPLQAGDVVRLEKVRLVEWE